MTRPSFVSTIHALALVDPRYDVAPTDEEADVAAVLEVIEAEHQGTADTPDDRGRWGRCTGCDKPWPCPSWAYGEEIAVQFLGRAADRVWAHAKTVITDLAARDRRAA